MMIWPSHDDTAEVAGAVAGAVAGGKENETRWKAVRIVMKIHYSIQSLSLSSTLILRLITSTNLVILTALIP